MYGDKALLKWWNRRVANCLRWSKSVGTAGATASRHTCDVCTDVVSPQVSVRKWCLEKGQRVGNQGRNVKCEGRVWKVHKVTLVSQKKSCELNFLPPHGWKVGIAHSVLRQRMTVTEPMFMKITLAWKLCKEVLYCHENPKNGFVMGHRWTCCAQQTFFYNFVKNA
jgi:hypothetical protein